MRRVFTDADLERAFDKDGFVQISLLGDEEMRDLRDLLSALNEEGKKGLASVESSYKLSFFHSDPAYRRTVFDRISRFFQPKVDTILDGYVPLIVNVFDKEPNEGEVPVHQNWTFVDESEFTSVSVWIPLQDVSRENGTLEAIPGSHRVLTRYRGPSIPWCFEDLLPQIRGKYSEPFNLRVGQAAVLDDSVVHWSSVNMSRKNRLAVQLIMVPKEATPIHYYRAEGSVDRLEVYEVDSEFFTRFKMNEKPDGVRRLGDTEFELKRYSEREFVEKIATNNPGILDLL